MYIIMNRQMNNRLPPKFIITSIAILYVLCFAGTTFAQELKASSSASDISDVKKEQAVKYRESGLEYQRMGNLPQALSYYQKAVSLYPNFAMAYNDIGVVYEALGSADQAAENYLKSIKTDPLYGSAYTNLALFYEGQRNFEKAAFYWGKRVEVGVQDDPWTQKAASRLRDIRRSLSGRPFADEREEEVLGLMKDVSAGKTEFNQKDENLSQAHFKKAKLSFNKGDMATAIREALDAQYLDQDNPEIEAFIEKAERRALMR
jgi:tetratricopeptide (TPR) repeat protein